MKFKSAIVTAGLIVAGTASASTIAVIDSGVDLKHKDLSGHAWVNPHPGLPRHHDKYVGDVNGWNFAENNNKIIDYKYLGTFSPDIYKFFELQKKALEGDASDADKTWMKSKIKDPAFIKEIEKFGNFVHGSHVAGISSHDNSAAHVMALKIIPTEQKIPGRSSLTSALETSYAFSLTDTLVKILLGGLAGEEAKMFEVFGQYVGQHHANVANCSFGTGLEQGKTIVGALLKLLLHHEPTPQQIDTYGKYFINHMVAGAAKMTQAAPDTMFVMAAGNDGSNNDVNPSSPANLRENNTITVAATMRNQKIASFSNYGKKMVDVAAPGVAIYSTVPGGGYLYLSGTSQASPYVANVVARVRDANPSLNIIDTRKIVMQTVDVKDFLSDKVLSSGVANPERAEKAAMLAKTMPVSQAIASSKSLVPDMASTMFDEQEISDSDVFVLPMPSTIK